MKLFLRFWLAMAVALTALTASAQPSGQTFDGQEAIAYCASQLRRSLAELHLPNGKPDYQQMPRNILEGQQRWNTRQVSAEEWCSGFWPGVLWMAYEATGDTLFRNEAEGFTASLVPLTRQPAYDHDLGFIVINSFLKGLEALKQRDGSSSECGFYRQCALSAADTLATLFNPTVGTILSWPRHVADYGGHNTIMDNMMNLELLFWADEETRCQAGDHPEHGRLYDIAVAHALTTMRHHFRPDGSCYHVAVYDTLDGHFIRGVTHQGYSDESMWSRGQSWAIYGYTMVYRYTHDRRFLRFAQKVADCYLRRLREVKRTDDLIPRWDMDAPDDVQSPSESYSGPFLRSKDASAACVVASALLELSQYVGKRKARAYRNFALASLQQLSGSDYQSRRRNAAFLLHSTGHRPAGSEIDASIIYADYYYLEALLRLRSTQQSFTQKRP